MFICIVYSRLSIYIGLLMIKVRSKLLRVYIATQLLYNCLARELFMRRKLTFKRGEGKKNLIYLCIFIKIRLDNNNNIVRLI